VAAESYRRFNDPPVRRSALKLVITRSNYVDNDTNIRLNV
jgi:hypothetical protein